eukprot:TRINITY_DN2302_c0_g1_i1.p1 TRINITY_DN2302_c0_g1~~TRINITY_DN2302_c0_g1_i1.p1  ORF type:complete len:269 (-),score=-69.77 TRINITY_DN2302_c0_g1_i1:577-1323(-)
MPKITIFTEEKFMNWIIGTRTNFSIGFSPKLEVFNYFPELERYLRVGMPTPLLRELDTFMKDCKPIIMPFCTFIQHILNPSAQEDARKMTLLKKSLAHKLDNSIVSVKQLNLLIERGQEIKSKSANEKEIREISQNIIAALSFENADLSELTIDDITALSDKCLEDYKRFKHESLIIQDKLYRENISLADELTEIRNKMLYSRDRTNYCEDDLDEVIMLKHEINKLNREMCEMREKIRKLDRIEQAVE